MRVVELEDDPVRQVPQVEVRRQDLVQEVPDRARDEEVLLLEAQLLALDRRVSQEFPQYLQLARPKPTRPSC